jgi:hypothetical protein
MGEGVISSNGATKLEMSEIVDVLGVLCDKHGVKKCRVKLTEVKLVPENQA